MPDTGISLIWTGADGSVWDWISGAQGVSLDRGLSGVLFPDFEQISNTTPYGRRYQHTRFKSVTVTANLQVCDLQVRADTTVMGSGVRRGAAWRELDRRVRRSLSPRTPGQLACTADGQTRYLRGLRLESIEDEFESMPDMRGRMLYRVELVDDQPFWRADPVIYDWAATSVSAASADYYGGYGPDFYIEAGNVTGEEHPISNPSDIEVWPEWEITGPVQATLTAGGLTTVLPDIGPGERLTIVTDPARRSITDRNGQPAWHLAPRRRFAPLPPGESPVAVQLNGAGTGARVRLILEPRFFSAW